MKFSLISIVDSSEKIDFQFNPEEIENRYSINFDQEKFDSEITGAKTPPCDISFTIILDDNAYPYPTTSVNEALTLIKKWTTYFQGYSTKTQTFYSGYTSKVRGSRTPETQIDAFITGNPSPSPKQFSNYLQISEERNRTITRASRTIPAGSTLKVDIPKLVFTGARNRLNTGPFTGMINNASIKVIKAFSDGTPSRVSIAIEMKENVEAAMADKIAFTFQNKQSRAENVTLKPSDKPVIVIDSPERRLADYEFNTGQRTRGPSSEEEIKSRMRLKDAYLLEKAKGNSMLQLSDQPSQRPQIGLWVDVLGF